MCENPDESKSKTPKRMWKPVAYKAGTGPPAKNVKGVETDINPFGASPPPKDQEVVGHPGVLQHMSEMKRGRLRGVAVDLSGDQKELLRCDFLEALELMNDAFVCRESEMWKVLEASRYANFNKSYGTCDVGVAVKLLIPEWLARNVEEMELQCWSVEPIKHNEGTCDLTTKFLVRPPRDQSKAGTLQAPTKSPPTSSSSASAVSGSSGASSRNASPLHTSAIPEPLARPPVSQNLQEAARRAAEVEAERKRKTALMLPPMPPLKSAGKEVAAPANMRQGDGASAVKSPAAAVAVAGKKTAGEEGPRKTVVQHIEDEAERVEAQAAIQLVKEVLKEERKEKLKADLAKLQQELLSYDEPEEDEVVSESEDEEDDEVWTPVQLLAERKLILGWHEKQRGSGSHTPATRGDPDFDQQKYALMKRHRKTKYDEKDGTKRFGRVPRSVEQGDELFSSVVLNCLTCQRQASERRHHCCLLRRADTWHFQ